MNFSLFYIEQTYNRKPCIRPPSFETTTRSTIHAFTFLMLSTINFCSNLLLLTIILFNWKTIFYKDFVYKFILTMSIIACSNALVHFVMTVPCTYMGCLFYSTRMMEFFTCLWETLEFGFFWTVFFIAIDRFLTFFFHDVVRYFHRKWSIVCIIFIGFCSQMLRFFVGCPKMYYVELFDTLPCLDCYVFTISWHETSRRVAYSLPFVMFMIYILIVSKIFVLRTKMYTTIRKFSKHDQMLALQFFLLCTIQLLCGFLQLFVNENETNYVGLLIISLPIDVQISNAIVLLVCNRVVKKGMKIIICKVRVDENKTVPQIDIAISKSHSNTNLRKDPVIKPTIVITQSVV